MKTCIKKDKKEQSRDNVKSVQCVQSTPDDVFDSVQNYIAYRSLVASAQDGTKWNQIMKDAKPRLKRASSSRIVMRRPPAQ